ncbi:hypothetical protein CSV71_12825 [Sporosarcina sp. P21c]|uniref:energy-coupling factor transporter transmembrane component T n=1 Tax=Sporosarcina TaxID=1569 RepID=UPI000A167359|nr:MULTISPECIES: energy-coupling factor transporter transmembrane component T [Sporosarcina]ARJ37736.1 hypothetical protein SporoP8_01855 [Sporosarcina ureae]PIC66149.1 hypothetical protein CSV78_13885 [Sporosarcina sp. P16a]PIC88790.1 hypothetical protein CSV71_12825 [Sporosarcina sp. P21c]PIC91813.1 hypothetical protein CSV70_13555 [Sporosarcina sp. P25]
MSAFSNFHPILLLVYVTVVLVTMFSSFHPIIVALAMTGGILYFFMLHGVRSASKDLIYYFFVFLLIAAAYPSYVHNGFTPLFFLNDHAVTLEAVTKGLVVAGAVVATSFWTKSYFEIFTTNKVLAVLTNVSANLGILVSMLWRFIPLFKITWREKQMAQRGIGYYKVGSRVEKLRRAFALWRQTLVQTAEFVFVKPDVMKARGYGITKERTQYKMMRFTKRDGILTAGLVLFLLYYIGYFTQHQTQYYPKISEQTLGAGHYVVIGLLMLLPFIYEAKESVKWRYLQSKI